MKIENFSIKKTYTTYSGGGSINWTNAIFWLGYLMIIVSFMMSFGPTASVGNQAAGYLGKLKINSSMLMPLGILLICGSHASENGWKKPMWY